VPLQYKPGELAEVDFFEVEVDLDGLRTTVLLFLMRLMASSRDFCWLYPRQDQVCFLDGSLIEAKGSRELGKLERRLARSKLLVLDELGFVPFDREGGELLFNLLSSRHRVSSTVITSNLAFSEWPKVFGGDEKLTAALLDRLAENAVVVATKGASFRARRRKLTET